MTITEEEVKKLQVIENGVFRQIMGAPKYAPNAALRGEVGASLMTTRIKSGRLQYIRGILQGRNQLLKEVLIEMMEDDKNKWMKGTLAYIKDIGLKVKDLHQISKEGLKKCTKNQDSEKWREEVKSKTTLVTYAEWKKEIEEVTYMDNQCASTIYFQARSNCLPLNERKRHTKEDTKCTLCNAEKEDIVHLILDCPAYSEEREATIHLQQPYEKADTLGKFLFEKEDVEEKKQVLYQIWKRRSREMKRSQST